MYPSKVHRFKLYYRVQMTYSGARGLRCVLGNLEAIGNWRNCGYRGATRVCTSEWTPQPPLHTVAVSVPGCLWGVQHVSGATSSAVRISFVLIVPFTPNVFCTGSHFGCPAACRVFCKQKVFQKCFLFVRKSTYSIWHYKCTAYKRVSPPDLARQWAEQPVGSWKHWNAVSTQSASLAFSRPRRSEGLWSCSLGLSRGPRLCPRFGWRKSRQV